MDHLLSVCMIIKNEEKVLDRCLNSLNGIADEIIIVDTGSNDQSKEIALRYTDKVFDFEWVDDFSKARNYAASKALGEWILVIDADEYVERDSFAEFKKKLSFNPPPNDINAVQIVNFVGENAKSTGLNRHTRLYRNSGLIEYYRPIHEVLRYKDGESGFGLVDLYIYHSGYMKDTAEEKQKVERNLPMLLELEKKTGIDYFYIGNEYNKLGETKKAIQYYQAAFKNRESEDADYITRLLVHLIDALYREKRYSEALEIIEGCEEAYPNHVDYKYYKGLIFHAQKEFHKARAIFEFILANKSKLLVDFSEDHRELLPLIHLANIYESEDELHKAVEYYSRAVSLNESNDSLWSKLLYLLGKHSSLEDLSQFINNKVVSAQGMTEQRMIKILLNVPLLDVQKLSRSLLEHEKLMPIENETLWMKNYFLDHNFEEVNKIIGEQTLGETVIMLRMNFFTLADYFIQLYEYENEQIMKTFNQIITQNKLDNIAKALFEEKHGKLNLNKAEKNIFVNIYRQATVLGIDGVVNKLDRKMFLLTDELRDEIKNIRNL